MTTEADKARLIASYGKLPLSFEPNHGQSSKQVRFLSRGSGYTLFLTGDEAVLALRSGKKESRPADRIASPKPGESGLLRMKLVRANSNARVVGLDELPGNSNYFIGNDPQQWRTNVPNYAKVRYENVYPGIDLVYYGNQRQLEYDFVVAPGADPKAIALEIAGADGAVHTTIGENGDLVIKTKGGEVRFHKPVVYQVENPASLASNRKSIDGHFVLLGKDRVGFEVSSYDHAKPLYIDPVISYATYLGGSGWDYGQAIAVDSAGFAYVAGLAESSDFPTTPGALNTGPVGMGKAFVSKLSTDGSSMVFSTFLGGSRSDRYDAASGIAVDSGGNVYVSGTTNSTDFPTLNAFQDHISGDTDYPDSDTFVAKLNPSGSVLLYSTYLGGDGGEGLYGIALDGSRNAYVAGATNSLNFPTVKAIQATRNAESCGYEGNVAYCSIGFVAKINPSAVGALSMVYSTYLGGSGSSGDEARAIAADNDGNAYVTGAATSGDFPITSGAFQTNLEGYMNAFVTKINAAGSAFTYSTFFGKGEELGVSIALDVSGNAYITGVTGSAGLPTTPGVLDASCGTDGQCDGLFDGFVTKFSADGSTLAYSTYLGGNRWDMPVSIVVDPGGFAYVAGLTTSDDYPVKGSVDWATQPPPCQPDMYYCGYAFISKLSAGGETLVASTFFGGNGYNSASGIALDASRNTYIAGQTSATDFPATPEAYQTTNAGSDNAFVVKLSELALPAVIQSTQSLNFGNQTVSTTSTAQTVTIKNVGDAATATLSFNITGDFQLSQTCAAAIVPGDNCTMDVTFTPTASGTRTGEVKKYNNLTGQWETFVSLAGAGVSPSLDVSSSSLTFADQLVGAVSKSQTVTLNNTGNIPVNFSSIQAATNFTHTTNCGDSLAVGVNCTINVTFAPKATGSVTEQITITHDAPGSPHTIALSGKGTDFSVLPASGALPIATVAAGEKATYGLSLSPTGFSGNVAMECKWLNGQPRGTSCSVSPSTVSLDGTNAATIAVTVSTTARSAVPSAWRPQPPASTGYPVSRLAIWVLALAVLASLALRRRGAAVVLASVLFATVLWTACGGGSPSVAPAPVNGTPAGTYTLSVTGTVSGVIHSTDLTLVVK